MEGIISFESEIGDALIMGAIERCWIMFGGGRSALDQIDRRGCLVLDFFLWPKLVKRRDIDHKLLFGSRPDRKTNQFVNDNLSRDGLAGL